MDRALKALLPDSKGLSEFAVDGKRYAQFRATTARANKRLDERSTALDGREANLQRGMGVLEQVVQRLEPVEKLLEAAKDDSDEGHEALVALVETLTKKKLNETTRRLLDKKLGKPTDPKVEALERELRAEKEKREARERAEEEAHQTAARQTEIRQHVQFLHQTLSKHDDHQVRTLASTRQGMMAIFEAQQQHYDRRTGKTLSAEQAARYVLEQKKKEIEPWQRVLGAKAPEPAATPTPAPPTTPATPEARVRSLGSRGSAPAAAGTAGTLSDAELFDKYERLAKLAGD